MAQNGKVAQSSLDGCERIVTDIMMKDFDKAMVAVRFHAYLVSEKTPLRTVAALAAHADTWANEGRRIKVPLRSASVCLPVRIIAGV